MDGSPGEQAADETGRTGDTPVREKTKAELKAERRAVQEAQRARKAETKQSSVSGVTKDELRSSSPQPIPRSTKNEGKVQNSSLEPSAAPVKSTQSTRNMPLQRTESKKPEHDRQRSFNSESTSVICEFDGAIGKLGIFSHLPHPEKIENLTRHIGFSSNYIIHPAIAKLGIQYSKGIISGSNARCVSLIHAMKQVISDYETPPLKLLCRDLELQIKPYINFLAQCRPLSVSMGNAIRHIKWLITHTPVEMSDSEAKATLLAQLDHYIEEKIVLAGKAIETYAAEKINDGDVILTYSCSSLVQQVLIDSQTRGKKFSVVVVDGRPKMEGRELLRRLVRHGLKCSYVHITAISYIMPEISKILLGAECLLANGYVMSRVGSSQIALVAKAFNVPILVCCETYKFCERVQTDSIVHNELGNPDDLVVPGVLGNEPPPVMMSRLNLMFDVTPPDMITMVITELGMVPCTSVPVVLRVKHALK